MKRFRFRLASLLRLRSQVERSARRELAIAMAEVHGFEQKLEAVARGLAESAEQAARTDAVGQLARSLEVGLRRHQWRLKEQRRGAEQKLDRARGAYATKARELSTLRNLRDKEHEAWRQETLREEQAELDELAMLSRGRKAAQQRNPAAGPAGSSVGRTVTW
ncbi:MAG: flagellar export protein FliJ [Planctomycetota bacterium]